MANILFFNASPHADGTIDALSYQIAKVHITAGDGCITLRLMVCGIGFYMSCKRCRQSGPARRGGQNGCRHGTGRQYHDR